MGGGHTGLDSYTKMWQQRAPQASLRVVLQARVFRLWWPSGPQLWRLIITAPCRVRLGGGGAFPGACCLPSTASGNCGLSFCPDPRTTLWQILPFQAYHTSRHTTRSTLLTEGR